MSDAKSKKSGTKATRSELLRAMVALGRSKEPDSLFDDLEDDIFTSLKTMGPRPGFGPGALGENSTFDTDSDSLPFSAQEVFRQLCAGEWAENLSGEPQAVRGDEKHGYSFKWGEREGFMIEWGDHWYCGPGTIGRDELMAIQRSLHRHFDLVVAPRLERSGVSAENIQAERLSFQPLRGLWPEEEEPEGLPEEAFLIFVAPSVGTVEGRRLFCGYDPVLEKTYTLEVELA